MEVLSRLRVLVPVLAALLAAACDSAAKGPEPARVAERHFELAAWERAWTPEELDTWRDGRVVAIEPGQTLESPDLPAVEGALVELFAPVRPGPFGEPLASARTDADGRFRVGPGPATDYLLRISAPGRALTLVGLGPAAASAGAFTPLPIAGGQIALRPAHPIQGRVDGPDGRPLPGVRVVATNLGYREEAQTDVLGRFAVRAPAGPVLLSLADPAYAAAPVSRTHEAAAADPPVLRARPQEPVRGWVTTTDGRRVEGAIVLDVSEPARRTTTGADGRFELAMPRSGRVAALAGGYGWRSAPVPRAGDLEVRIAPTPGVRGVVRDAGGSPVEDARVVAVGLSYDGLAERIAGPRTGPDGSFDFAWLPRPPRGSGGEIRIVALRRGQGESAIATATSFPPSLDLKLLGARDVRGRVTLADGAAAPASLVEAVWVHADGGVTPHEIAVLGLEERTSTITGPDGAYRLARVPLGLHAKVQCRRAGVVLERFIEGDAAARGFDFTFPRGQPLAGRVVAAGGAAPEGSVRVMVQLLNAPGVSVTRTAAADADGRFRFDDLPDGQYQIRADGDRYDLPAGAVECAGKTDVVVEIQRTATLGMRFVFDDAERPRTPLRLQVLPVKTRGQPISDAIDPARLDERVELRGLDPGEWKLSVAGDVWRARVDSLVLGDGERREIDVPLRRTIRVAARLLDERGKPLPGQLVVLARADGGAPPELATSAADGALDLTGLSPGRWRATAHPPGRPPLAEEFDVAATGGAPLEWRLPPAGSLDVRVTLEGEPVGGAVVSLRDAAGRPIDAWSADAAAATSVFRADAEGRVLIAGVRSGRVRIEARSGPSVVGTREAEVLPDKTTEVEFE